MHGFQAGFEQELFQKRITDLNVGPFGFRGFAEFLAGHGRTVNSVTASFRADVNYGIAFARSLRIKDLVFADESECEGIHQRITRVAGLDLGFAAEIGDSKAVAIRRNAADHAFKNGVVAMDVFLGCLGGRGRPPHTILNRSKAQRVHNRYRPRAHSENVA